MAGPVDPGRRNETTMQFHRYTNAPVSGWASYIELPDGGVLFVARDGHNYLHRE